MYKMSRRSVLGGYHSYTLDDIISTPSTIQRGLFNGAGDMMSSRAGQPGTAHREFIKSIFGDYVPNNDFIYDKCMKYSGKKSCGVHKNNYKYNRAPKKGNCYILLLDDPTLLKILCHLSPKDIFITLPAVCSNFYNLSRDKYILNAIKNRLYLTTNYLGANNELPEIIPQDKLYMKLRNIYFNNFKIYYYHDQGKKQYIHGTAVVTIYAEETLNSLRTKPWWPRKSMMRYDLYFTRNGHMTLDIYDEKWHNVRFIDYVWYLNNSNVYSVPYIRWTAGNTLYIRSTERKFYNCPFVELTNTLPTLKLLD
jgi:hypothetical protein